MLNLDWNIVWTFVNIIVLYLLLQLFLFKPVNRMMEKRSAAIAASVEEANTKNAEAEEKRIEYERVLQRAKDESIEILQQARQTAAAQSERILAEAQRQAEACLEDARKTAELEREKSIQSASAEIAGLAMMAAARVIEEKADSDTDKIMVEKFLAEARRT